MLDSHKIYNIQTSHDTHCWLLFAYSGIRQLYSRFFIIKQGFSKLISSFFKYLDKNCWSLSYMEYLRNTIFSRTSFLILCTNTNYVRIFGDQMKRGFSGAFYMISQSFQSLQENPIATTILPYPIVWDQKWRFVLPEKHILIDFSLATIELKTNE